MQDGRKSEIKEESKMKLSACDSTRTEINFSRSKNSNERSDIGRKKDTSRGNKAFYYFLIGLKMIYKS